MSGGRSRFEPRARLVDWTILVLVAVEVCSGLVSLVAGTPDWWWLFAAHAVAGIVLVISLFWKLRRVRHRLTRDSWDRATGISVGLVAVALAALATGLYWNVAGLVWIGPWTLLTGHALLGLAVAPLLLWHLRHRFRVPSRADVEGRRTALQYGALLVSGALVWRLQQLLFGADRFTGSKTSDGDGNDFPVTSWVADDPEPIDPDRWSLRVDGAVDRPLSIEYDDLIGDSGTVRPDAGERCVLDCTSGWYADRNWTGVRVGDLLGAVEPSGDARWVQFRSVTGYRWSLPIEEARDALLATRVDGDALTHGHGAPLRLVAPGRRGFQWVKWVTGVEVTERRDYSEWAAIFLSGL